MLRSRLFAVALALMPALALAAGTDIAFGGLKTDTKQPVQVTADQLSVNQTDGTAEFKGNVQVTQGTMTLQAATVRVEYAADKKSIARMLASGGVKLAAGTDAAQAANAEYRPDSGDLVLTGDVILTQTGNAISGEKLTVNLKTGLGTMEGRVTTTFTPAQPKKN